MVLIKGNLILRGYLIIERFFIRSNLFLYMHTNAAKMHIKMRIKTNIKIIAIMIVNVDESNSTKIDSQFDYWRLRIDSIDDNLTF